MFFLVDSSSSAFSYGMFSKQNILVLYIQIYNSFVLLNVYVLIRPFPFKKLQMSFLYSAELFQVL